MRSFKQLDPQFGTRRSADKQLPKFTWEPATSGRTKCSLGRQPSVFVVHHSEYVAARRSIGSDELIKSQNERETEKRAKIEKISATYPAVAVLS